jgi:hypothetical protein
MLLSQSLLRFLECLRDDTLDSTSFSPVLLSETIPLVTLQILMRVLRAQQQDGSWQSKHEVTAYALISLTALVEYPFLWMRSFQRTIASAMIEGKRFLLQRQGQWSSGEYIWIEKVTYTCPTISMSYCLAACMVTPRASGWHAKSVDLLGALVGKPSNSTPRFQILHSLEGIPLERVATVFARNDIILRYAHQIEPQSGLANSQSTSTAILSTERMVHPQGRLSLMQFRKHEVALLSIPTNGTARLMDDLCMQNRGHEIERSDAALYPVWLDWKQNGGVRLMLWKLVSRANV